MEGRSSAEWMELLRSLDVPTMPVNTIDALLTDEHLGKVGFFSTIDHPTEGRYTHVRNPLRFSSGLVDARVEPAALGQHTVEVLRESRVRRASHRRAHQGRSCVRARRHVELTLTALSTTADQVPAPRELLPAQLDPNHSRFRP